MISQSPGYPPRILNCKSQETLWWMLNFDFCMGHDYSICVDTS